MHGRFAFSGASWAAFSSSACVAEIGPGEHRPFEEFVRFGVLRHDLNGFAKVRDGFLGAVLVEKQVSEVNEGSRILYGRIPLPLYRGVVGSNGVIDAVQSGVRQT